MTLSAWCSSMMQDTASGKPCRRDNANPSSTWPLNMMALSSGVIRSWGLSAPIWFSRNDDGRTIFPMS